LIILRKKNLQIFLLFFHFSKILCLQHGTKGLKTTQHAPKNVYSLPSIGRFVLEIGQKRVKKTRKFKVPGRLSDQEDFEIKQNETYGIDQN